MTIPAALLERYLRQRRELGEIELVMEQPFSFEELQQVVKGAISREPATDLATQERPGRVQPSESVTPPQGGSSRQDPALASEGLPKAGIATRPRPVDGQETHAPPAPVPALSANHPLTVLNLAASGCTACGLASSRTTVVFGEGNPQARLVVVGEAPGADEDRTGRPFVGKAGALLNTLLQSIGFPRESVYICNVLKCRPPGNRNPLPAEVEACSHFLQGQLEAISPKAILAVGTFPAQALLRTTEPIGRLRGTVQSFDGIPLVPTYHPAALLRNPGWIRPVWEDLQRLRQVIDAA